MTIQGWLLVLVALLHVAMTPEIASIVARNTTPKAFAFIWPPYALDHIVVGVLLAAVGIGTILCASAVAQGNALARRIAWVNAVAVLALPIAVLIAVPLDTVLGAPAFLLSAVMLAGTGFWMLWPILGKRSWPSVAR